MSHATHEPPSARVYYFCHANTGVKFLATT